MKIGIIVASHGEFARAALEAVELITGEADAVSALSLPPDRSLESFEAELRDAWSALNATCDLVVALCDIAGGTPFNAIARCLLSGLDMVAFTGLSLPVLVELLIRRDALDSADAVRRLLRSAHARALREIAPNAPSKRPEDELDL